MPNTYSIVGMNFRNSEGRVQALQPGHPVRLVREPNNPHDANAVAVYVDGAHVGYIPKKSNVALAAFIDQTGAPDATMAMDERTNEPLKAIDATFVRSPNSGYPQVTVDGG